MESTDLDNYYKSAGLALHETGLLGYYGSRGLAVRQIELKDYKKPGADDQKKVLAAFDALPKPVLIHCSAGIDRTTPTAAYVAYHRQPAPPVG